MVCEYSWQAENPLWRPAALVLSLAIPMCIRLAQTRPDSGSNSLVVCALPNENFVLIVEFRSQKSRVPLERRLGVF